MRGRGNELCRVVVLFPVESCNKKGKPVLFKLCINEGEKDPKSNVKCSSLMLKLREKICAVRRLGIQRGSVRQ